MIYNGFQKLGLRMLNKFYEHAKLGPVYNYIVSLHKALLINKKAN